MTALISGLQAMSDRNESMHQGKGDGMGYRLWRVIPAYHCPILLNVPPSV